MDWPEHQKVCQQLGVLCLQYAPQPPPLSLLLSLTPSMDPAFAARFSTWVRANHERMQAAAEEEEDLHMAGADEDEESEDNDAGAADHGDFDGPRLVVAGRAGRGGGAGATSILPGQSNIWTGNMPLNITESKLTSIFSAYGPVTRVSISKARRVSPMQDPHCFPGIGFVRMDDKDAVRAILALNNSKPLPGQIKELDVRVARSDPPAVKRLAPLLAAARRESAPSSSSYGDGTLVRARCRYDQTGATTRGADTNPALWSRWCNKWGRIAYVKAHMSSAEQGRLLAQMRPCQMGGADAHPHFQALPAHIQQAIGKVAYDEWNQADEE